MPLLKLYIKNKYTQKPLKTVRK